MGQGPRLQPALGQRATSRPSPLATESETQGSAAELPRERCERTGTAERCRVRKFVMVMAGGCRLDQRADRAICLVRNALTAKTSQSSKARKKRKRVNHPTPGLAQARFA